MDRIDRLLLAEEELTPSAEFQQHVMEAVRAESETPPLPFPWLSLVLGFVVVPILALAALWWLLPLVPAPLLLGARELVAADGIVDLRWLWLLTVSGGSLLVILWSFRLAGEV